MMTKKDYIKFADMIAEEINRFNTNSRFSMGAQTAILNIRIGMIQLFKSDNPNFDPDRFNTHIEKKVKSLSE